jgi:hypothetical protein
MDPAEALNQLLRNLIQNLQVLNQKVNRDVRLGHHKTKTGGKERRGELAQDGLDVVDVQGRDKIGIAVEFHQGLLVDRL